MNISEHNIAIDNAFALLMASIEDTNSRLREIHTHHGIRVCRDLPRSRDPGVIPRIPSVFQPMAPMSTHNKETLLQLAAFEDTYHDAKTPISPDMVPLIIDTGASITVSPYKTDFVSPIKPVQAIEIKGIASGRSWFWRYLLHLLQ